MKSESYMGWTIFFRVKRQPRGSYMTKTVYASLSDGTVIGSGFTKDQALKMARAWIQRR